MKKFAISLVTGLLAVNLFAPVAQAASYKLKLTVVQTDGVVRIYDDEDQSQKGANKKCMSGPLIWNPEPWSVGSIILKTLVQGNTKVKVLGSSNQTVGLGKITAAKFVETSSYEDEDPEIGFVMEGYCKYSATVTVENSKFYKILIGSSSGYEVSLSELKKKKWNLALELSN